METDCKRRSNNLSRGCLLSFKGTVDGRALVVPSLEGALVPEAVLHLPPVGVQLTPLGVPLPPLGGGSDGAGVPGLEDTKGEGVLRFAVVTRESGVFFPHASIVLGVHSCCKCASQSSGSAWPIAHDLMEKAQAS